MTTLDETMIMSLIPGLTREPKSWQERQAEIKYVWDKPFVWFDCRLEWFFFRCRQKSFNDSLNSLIRSPRN